MGSAITFAVPKEAPYTFTVEYHCSATTLQILHITYSSFAHISTIEAANGVPIRSTKLKQSTLGA